MKEMNELQYRDALAMEQPVLVEFYAPWCVYCRRIAPALEQLARSRAGSLVVGRVNIDEQSELARRERIEVVPTLVLYHRGEDLGSIVAPESRARIEEFLEDFLGN